MVADMHLRLARRRGTEAGDMEEESTQGTEDMELEANLVALHRGEPGRRRPELILSYGTGLLLLTRTAADR